MHTNLVHGFFHNAIWMLRADGEIHVNHKTTAPFCHWNIKELGLKNCLVLIECVDFKKEDYPGYHNKRGDGPRCDEPFPLGECSTFKFRLSPTAKRYERPQQFQRISRAGHLTIMEQTSQRVSFPVTSSTGNSFSTMIDGHLFNPTVTFGGTNHDLRHSFHTPRPAIQGNSIQMQQWLPSINFSSRAGHLMNVEQISPQVSMPLRSSRNPFSWMMDGHLINSTEAFGGTNNDLRHSYHAPRPNFARDYAAMPGRTLSGDLYALREHNRICILRLRWQKRLLGLDYQLNESDEQQLEYGWLP